MKRYNTPHRRRVIKTRLTEEEYAEFEQRIIEIAERIASDYYGDLLPQIKYAEEGSFLEEMDELNVGYACGTRWHRA